MMRVRCSCLTFGSLKEIGSDDLVFHNCTSRCDFFFWMEWDFSGYHRIFWSFSLIEVCSGNVGEFLIGLLHFAGKLVKKMICYHLHQSLYLRAVSWIQLYNIKVYILLNLKPHNFSILFFLSRLIEDPFVLCISDEPYMFTWLVEKL